MKKRYQLGKVIVVSDRGMMSRTNMEIVENSDYEFIVGKSIKQLKKVDIFDGEFTEISKGIEYREIEYEGGRNLPPLIILVLFLALGYLFTKEIMKKNKKQILSTIF
jgi:hypothetical protein